MLDEFITYLGIDEPDDMICANAKRALSAADHMVYSAVGDNMTGDSRYKELVFIYAEDLYSNRGGSGKVSAATKQLTQRMELQLKLEHRQYFSDYGLAAILTGGVDFS